MSDLGDPDSDKGFGTTLERRGTNVELRLGKALGDDSHSPPMAELLEVFLRITMAGLAAILAFLTLAAYARVRSGKLLLVGLAFLAFFAKGAILVAGIFEANAFALLPTSAAGLLLDDAVLALMYTGTVKG